MSAHPKSDIISTVILLGALYLVCAGLWAIGGAVCVLALVAPMALVRRSLDGACRRQMASNERFMRRQGLRK